MQKDKCHNMEKAGINPLMNGLPFLEVCCIRACIHMKLMTSFRKLLSKKQEFPMMITDQFCTAVTLTTKIGGGMSLILLKMM